jgi:hypothetical protein
MNYFEKMGGELTSFLLAIVVTIPIAIIVAFLLQYFRSWFGLTDDALNSIFKVTIGAIGISAWAFFSLKYFPYKKKKEKIEKQ